MLILIKHEKGREQDKMYVVICLAEYFLEDSDLEGLSDITVSSVHTSDLSSFEGESENEVERSDSSEEGELPSDGLYCLQFMSVKMLLLPAQMLNFKLCVFLWATLSANR